MSKLRVFESFSGVGCTRMALRNLGIDYEVVGTSEVDKTAILCYDAIFNNNEKIKEISKEEMIKEIENKHIAYNFSNGKSEIPRGESQIKQLYEAHMRSKNYGDIRLIDEKTLPDFDLLTLSSPCKNISTAGDQRGLAKGSDTQSSLIWEIFRIIEYKKPKYILMENVKAIILNKYKDDLEELLNTFKELGYVLHWDILNGKNFGVAQNRERFIMMAVLKEYDNGQDLPTSNGKKIKTIKDILEDNEGSYLTDDFLKKFIPNENYKSVNPIELPVSIGYIKKSPNGKKHQSNTVYDMNCVARTIVAGEYKSPLMVVDMTKKDLEIRRLSSLECWKLLGADIEDYYKCKNIGISKTKMYERSGRGIIVPMLEEVFKTYLI